MSRERIRGPLLKIAEAEAEDKPKDQEESKKVVKIPIDESIKQKGGSFVPISPEERESDQVW